MVARKFDLQGLQNSGILLPCIGFPWQGVKFSVREKKTQEIKRGNDAHVLVDSNNLRNSVPITSSVRN